MSQKTTQAFKERIRTVAGTDCHPEVKLGLRGIANELLPAHSLNSRNPSLWSLLQRLLDQPVMRVVEDCPGLWNKVFLSNFLPSKLGTQPPGVRVIERLALKDPWWAGCYQHRTKAELARRPRTVDEYKANIQEWRVNIRFAVRSNRFANKSEQTVGEQYFLGTLDTLIALCDLLRSRVLEPQTTRPAKGIRLRVPTWQGSDDVQQFCELCWRNTEAYEARRVTRDNDTPRAYSKRYCAHHLRQEKPEAYNSYRADRRYRAAFHQELMSFTTGDDSVYGFCFNCPVAASFDELRKAAFDTVHCGVRPLRGRIPGAMSFAEQVWRLHQDGFTQAKTAKELDVHRQAVSRKLKHLYHLAALHETDAQIDPLTAEPFSLHTNATRTLFASVQRLHNSGWSTARIARHLCRFPSTVKSVYRWLDAYNQVLFLRTQGGTATEIASRLRIPEPAVLALADMRLGDSRTHDFPSKELERLLQPVHRIFADPAVHEIVISDPCMPLIKRKGEERQPRQHYVANMHQSWLEETSRLIAQANYQPVSKSSPLFTGWLDTGERVSIVAPTVTNALQLSIRKPYVPLPY